MNELRVTLITFNCTFKQIKEYILCAIHAFARMLFFARDIFANDSLPKKMLQLFSNKFARNALADYVFLLYIDCKKYFTSALAINIYVGNIFVGIIFAWLQQHNSLLEILLLDIFM